MSLPAGVLPASAAFAWPRLPVDIALLKTLSDRTVQPGNQYEFGGKVDLDADSAEVRAEGVDCSGYVRWLIHRATNGAVTMPDGSWVQHEWVQEAGFKPSTIASAQLLDGYLRIAFMSPRRGGGIGHVALILDGQTMESHGGAGPNRRKWAGTGWQAKTKVYVLAAPTNGRTEL